MNEPDISPLAKRLAEENNVRWQELNGSGAGGKVVERDVLEYLARVMAGEEALDPTPEPVPEGMQAWPETDVASFRHEAKRGDLGDLQAELSASDRYDSDGDDLDMGGFDASLHADPEASDDAELISEDIFLFEESGQGYDASAYDDDDGLLIAGEEEFSADVAVEDAPSLRVLEGSDDAPYLGASSEVAEFAAADFEESADASAAADGLPDIFGDTEPSIEEDDALFAEVDDEPYSGEDVAATAEVEVLRHEHEVPQVPEVDPWFSADVDEAGLELPDEELDLGSGVADMAAVADAEALDFEAEQDVMEFGSEQDAMELGTEQDAMEAGAETELFDVAADVAESTGEAESAYAVAADLHDTPMTGEAGTEGEPLEAIGAAEADDGDDVVVEAAESAALPLDAELMAVLPLVTHGTLLRRHIDLSSLSAAQLAVGREIADGDPIPPVSFLVRAAAKAQMREPLGEGGIGVATFGEGFGLYCLEDAAVMPYPALVEAMQAAESVGAEVDGMALVVADMSAFDVDEAVLHLGVPVLTLGRVLYDNKQGSYRSTLSLAGDVAPERGARFLARVAELLDAPVQLIL